MSLPADQPATLEELVRQAFAGSQAARQALCKSVTPHLYARLRRMTTELQAIEDTLQETWVRVFQKQDRFDASRPFLPWITQVACNLLRDLWRRRAAHPVTALPLQEPNDDDPLPLDLMLATENAERLRQCIGRLEESDRRMIVLRFWEDCPFEEIHTRLGAWPTPAATRSRYYRVLRQLLECLNLDELKPQPRTPARAPRRRKRKG
jgi:RNA polymerase sigma-70 factor (ECF subfamily)